MSNQLTGPVPSLSGLSSLQFLFLNNNNFSSIPSDFFLGMTSLQGVYLDYNPFLPWRILKSLQNASALQFFSANAANIIGNIPEFFGGFVNLGSLHLAFNNLEGGLLGSFSGSSIRSLWLNGQQGISSKLNGSIGVIQNMTQLNQVWSHSNSFSGPLPELSGLTRLQNFSVRDNRITGLVPVSLKAERICRMITAETQGTKPVIRLSLTLKFCSLVSPESSGKGPKEELESMKMGLSGMISPNFSSITSAKQKHSWRVQSPNAMVVHPHHSGSDHDDVKITIADLGLTGGTTGETYSHDSRGPSDTCVIEARNMVISIQVLKTFNDGTKIAVKRMESGVVSDKGLDEFNSESAVLTKVRHRHLVSLLGYCLDGNERLLVYEYMPQGTLSRHLFHWNEEGGVEYLHALAHQSFIHRDLKPTNILLGDDMRAKVADFGLVRLAPDGNVSVETKLAGTFGYLAPEYAETGRVTTKSDVYSFGVILMELITGRKALDQTQKEESVHLVTWFRRMHNKDTFRKAIDPTIDLDEETVASVSTVAELAGHCCARASSQRPDMGHAVNVLSSLTELWKPSDPDADDIYGIDFDMTLPQAVKKWQALATSSSALLGSGDNSQSVI
ncbi:unnamed protein product [Camellia sinensis]